MARYEFKFVVDGAKLSDEHRWEIARAVASGGGSALIGGVPKRHDAAAPAGPAVLWGKLLINGIPAFLEADLAAFRAAEFSARFDAVNEAFANVARGASAGNL
jgi:hypothetical protein